MRALVCAALCACGCASAAIRPRPAVIFEDSSFAFDYRADTGKAAREVHGESCRSAVGLPPFLWGGWDAVAWGDAGYRDAVAKAQAQAPGARLSDVRADIHYINILVWRQECLQITAAAR